MIALASVTNKIVHLHQFSEIVVKMNFNAHLADPIIDCVFRAHGFVMAISIAIMDQTSHRLVKEHQHVVEDILNATIVIGAYHKRGLVMAK